MENIKKVLTTEINKNFIIRVTEIDNGKKLKQVLVSGESLKKYIEDLELHTKILKKALKEQKDDLTVKIRGRLQIQFISR